MTQPTVTLPREAEIRAAFHKRYGPLVNYESYDATWFVGGYLAALDAPATVDCRGCQHAARAVTGRGIVKSIECEYCTDFDKFQALPPVVLTKVTK